MRIRSHPYRDALAKTLRSAGVQNSSVTGCGAIQESRSGTLAALCSTNLHIRLKLRQGEEMVAMKSDKINKVKNGLECCIVRETGGDTRCSTCPYRDPSLFCLNELLNDALDIIQTMTNDNTSSPDGCGL